MVCCIRVDRDRKVYWNKAFASVQNLNHQNLLNAILLTDSRKSEEKPKDNSKQVEPYHKKGQASQLVCADRNKTVY